MSLNVQMKKSTIAIEARLESNQSPRPSRHQYQTRFTNDCPQD